MIPGETSIEAASPVAPDTINLPAYLERIGYTGPLNQSPDALATLVKQHMAAIPFEAIDVMLGRAIDLAPDTVDRKLVLGRRGGYCFEQASLMRRVLRAVGFPVTPYLARVWSHCGLDGPTPRATHATLKVEAGGQPWLVDVGFGRFMPNEPLAWQPGVDQNTAFGTFRLTETRDGLLLESWYIDRWTPLYEVLDFHWQPVDFEVANHYTSTHPDSAFRHNLMVARTQQQTRSTLLGNRLKRVTVDGSREERVLNAEGLAETLATLFGLPVAPDWKPLLERVAAGADPSIPE